MNDSRRLLQHFLAALASENFIFARVEAANVGAEQAEPAAPDAWWRPDQPPMPPGQRPPITDNR